MFNTYLLHYLPISPQLEIYAVIDVHQLNILLIKFMWHNSSLQKFTLTYFIHIYYYLPSKMNVIVPLKVDHIRLRCYIDVTCYLEQLTTFHSMGKFI